jgi:hypothetical protein
MTQMPPSKPSPRQNQASHQANQPLTRTLPTDQPSAFEVIEQTLMSGRAHPTLVMNTLIELENQAGESGVLELEQRLTRLVVQMSQQNQPRLPLARAWLEAVRGYLEWLAEEMPFLPAFAGIARPAVSFEGRLAHDLGVPDGLEVK